MKKSRFITLVVILLLGFGIVIYQNYRELDYLRVLDIRQGDIYKDTGRIISTQIGIREDIDIIKRSH